MDQQVYNGITSFPPFGYNYIESLQRGSTDMVVHDRYNVYVNDDYIGQKILLCENEDINDVASYLQSQGFHDFNTKLEGNSFSIKCDDDKKLKKTLDVYLSIR
ncbi:MAG: hypothetical protein Q8900_06245 [Bacillota bacterium]|nr:hypothetical protein [Bacillota bacterium]